MSELGTFQIQDSIRFQIELKNISDILQDATTIKLNVVDFDDTAIISNMNMTHDGTGLYSQDIFLDNNSFSEGGHYVTFSGDASNFSYYEESFFYINKNRIV